MNLCPHCTCSLHVLTPFSHSDASLLDYISAIMFVAVPIAWIPLIILFSVLALNEQLSELFNSDYDEDRQQSHTDYDREVKPFCVYSYPHRQCPIGFFVPTFSTSPVKVGVVSVIRNLNGGMIDH